MELALSGNALKTFHRCVTCLARVGTELVLQASPSQLVFHTLNSSRSAYQSITLKPDFFDVYSLTAPPPVQCSVLLKAICSILRTPVSGVDRLAVLLPTADAPKVQFTLDCLNGVKKTYWITCNVEPDIQHLSLDRTMFPSSFVVRPRDLSRLLGNFQSSLQELTVIATEPGTFASDVAGEIGGKAVELRSYIDPTKDNSDTTLHTQLWIDPSEEFLQYTHTGDPVDVTFALKELKAFLSFCEGCEVDIHLFFEKAGEPILLAPKFGYDDGSISDFDTTLVLATMLVSQLHDGNDSQNQHEAGLQQMPEPIPESQHTRAGASPASDRTSDHTKIWSELSGSVSRERHLRPGVCHTSTAQQQGACEVPCAHNTIERPKILDTSKRPLPNELDAYRHRTETDQPDRVETNGVAWSQHHPSNWVDPDYEDEEDDDVFVQSTPQY